MPGKPLGSSNENNTHNRTEIKQALGESGYRNLIQMCAKAAMASQNWQTLEEDEPLYMIITISVKAPQKLKPAERHEAVKGKRIVVRAPSIHRFCRLFVSALKGLVFRREKQLVAINIVRQCSKQEGVSVLIGSPKNWSELNNDLRNA